MSTSLFSWFITQREFLGGDFALISEGFVPTQQTYSAPNYLSDRMFSSVVLMHGALPSSSSCHAWPS